jgi:hypothetical protein
LKKTVKDFLCGMRRSRLRNTSDKNKGIIVVSCSPLQTQAE